jgi:CheY-like chemotaxis protein
MEERRHKVLIVDDDPAVLELYRDLLSKLPSHPEIFTTTSGARALAMLNSQPFRLLLCDLKMPKMDGLQVLTIVRRRFPELRTVVMTAVHNEEFRSRAYSLGVDLFWLKPDTQQNMEMFLQCIEGQLGRDEESGFRGLQSKSLMDLIQMECLSQTSTVLRVTRGSITGRIWITSGELIDAETDGARGENAFRRILAWKAGTFENLPAEPSRERTINKSSNALLLEAAQAMDEVAAPSKQTAEEVARTDNRKTVLRLASLTRVGADFVVALPQESDGEAEGWGTEATQEFGAWMRLAVGICQKLGRELHAGDLELLDTRSMDQRIILLPEKEKTFMVGWPAAKTDQPGEKTKQLVASWDS